MRVRLALLGAMIVVIAACGAYENQPVTYHQVDAAYVKPKVWGMNVRKIKVDDGGSDAICAIGLTAAGVGVVTAVAFAPIGVTAWATFGAVGGGAAAGWGLGQSLGYCWDTYNQYRDVFDVFTSCPVNHPIMQSTFDDYMGLIAFVNMDSCWCSFACQIGFDDPYEVDPRWKLWPGISPAGDSFRASKNYWHAGANHVNRAETEPVVPDFPAMAASLGLEYAGCDGVGVYKTC